MVKVTFNSALAQKEAKKDEPKSGEEALIIPPDTIAVDCKDPDEVVPVGQRRAWCWCMCFGLAFMLAGVILGGAYLYKYFALQPDDVYYCGIKYIKDDVILNEPPANAPAARYQTIEENIKIFEEDGVEFISVPVPEFADSDPANIVHDFNKKLTAYLDLNLDKCYVIPLNTSIVMPPRNLLELLINIKAGTYLPQSYLIHEHMVITDRIENIDHLGFYIYRLCHDKETYKLQRKETVKGPEEEAEKPVKTKTVSSSNGGESSSRSAEKRSAEEEAADLPTKPTKISKFGFAIGSQTTKKASAISIKLGSTKPKETVPTLAPKTLSVAAAFNEDEDSEPEEMPPEAKMRMKNIGRDTPTSAGPNSFNKGKHGFSDNQKLWERNIKSHLGNVHDQDN